MTKEQIDAIIYEVLRRMEIAAGEHKALLLMDGHAAPKALGAYLESLVEEGYVFTQLLKKNESVCSQVKTVHRTISPSALRCEEDLVEMVSHQDVLVISGMTLAQTAALRELRIEGLSAKLICEFLRQGKTVNIISDYLSLDQAPPAFGGKMRHLIAELESWGICFHGVTGDSGVYIEKNIITKQDLKRVYEGPVVLDKRTALTTTAKNLLQERNIEILRR